MGYQTERSGANSAELRAPQRTQITSIRLANAISHPGGRAVRARLAPFRRKPCSGGALVVSRGLRHLDSPAQRDRRAGTAGGGAPASQRALDPRPRRNRTRRKRLTRSPSSEIAIAKIGWTRVVAPEQAIGEIGGWRGCVRGRPLRTPDARFGSEGHWSTRYLSRGRTETVSQSSARALGQLPEHVALRHLGGRDELHPRPRQPDPPPHSRRDELAVFVEPSFCVAAGWSYREPAEAVT